VQEPDGEKDLASKTICISEYSITPEKVTPDQISIYGQSFALSKVHHRSSEIPIWSCNLCQGASGCLSARPF
jgi:hypothetical protein